MKIVKIGFSKTFPTGPYFEKIFLEAEVIEGDDIRQSLYALKKQIEQFHFESQAAAEKQKGTYIKEQAYKEAGLTEEEIAVRTPSREQAITQQINECTDLKVLESFSMLAKNYPEIKEAYEKKLKQLQP